MKKLTNKQYDNMQWVVRKVLPALIVLIGTVGGVLGYDTTVIVTIVGAFNLFLGQVLSISSDNYQGGEPK